MKEKGEKSVNVTEYCCDAALRALIELIGSIVKSYCVDGAWNCGIAGGFADSRGLGANRKAMWVMLAFCGLAYSLFPWLVVDRLTIWQAASSNHSLSIIFVGGCVVLPVIVGYTVFSYRGFQGKATALEY